MAAVNFLALVAAAALPIRRSSTGQYAESMVTKRRVVVTGLGVICPLGSTVESAWDAILKGESGIAPITRFDVSAFPTRFGGAVRGFNVEEYMSAKEARRVDEFIHYGIAAGVQAVNDAGMDLERLDRDRCGVIAGAGIGGLWTIEQTHAAFADSGRNPRKISPFFVPSTIINMIAGHLSIRWRRTARPDPGRGDIACTTSNACDRPVSARHSIW